MLDEKDEPPLEIADDQASGDGAKHGSDECRDGDEAHGAEEIGFGEGPHEGEPAYRDHHGAADALKDAAGHEEMNVARDATEKRAEGEDSDGRGKDSAGSEFVGHPAADGDEDGQAQGVAGEDGLHAECSDVKSCRDGGNGRVEDGRVERFHEESERYQPRQQALACVGWNLQGGDDSGRIRRVHRGLGSES